MEEKIIFNCSHGTPRSNKELIEKNGLRKSEGSLGFLAVYFWVSENDTLLDHLAKFWVKTNKKDCKEVTIIKCKVEILKKDVLDMSSYDFISSYKRYVNTHYREKKDFSEWSEEEHKSILNNFLFSFESGKKKAFLTRHWIPDNKDSGYPLKTLGSPFCLAVKELDLINKEKMKIFSQKI